MTCYEYFPKHNEDKGKEFYRLTNYFQALENNMVWCPIHHKYLNGRRAKSNHAFPDNHGYMGCNWMKNYIHQKERNRGLGVLK